MEYWTVLINNMIPAKLSNIIWWSKYPYMYLMVDIPEKNSESLIVGKLVRFVKSSYLSFLFSSIEKEKDFKYDSMYDLQKK
ncbi:hypothetical protein [Methanobacterium paludis]|uniref:hypothetical protein n=1 Tax=Methanobacterium paludis (strain DSM 25820 / JCM 18151 / SWAN1) TaxID=868131 RepID=UPI0013764687|nr:hypothetical protein [Methanobacterium paludis]